MADELSAITRPGERMVDLASRHGADFATRAADHDRDSCYVSENIEAMRESGLLGACAPASHGGLGVESLHDVMVAVSRLARGCASSALCANMHVANVWQHRRAWEQAKSSGDAPAEARLDALLYALGDSDVIFSGAATEPGAGWNSPLTEAVATPDGYVVNGRKTFATNSEIADSVTVTVRVSVAGGGYRHGIATIIAGTPGMTVRRDWDALGMRGSGSHSILFEDCRVPAERVVIGEPIGVTRPADMLHAAVTNFPLSGVYLGIAEAAFRIAAEHAAARRPAAGPMAHSYPVQHRIAEMSLELACARGALHRCGEELDELLADAARRPAPDRAWPALSLWQCTKLLVNKAAATVVDQAMSVCGGASYLSAHPLARLYRDVRAGGFMQPLGQLDAHAFIGRTALGLPPFPDAG